MEQMMIPDSVMRMEAVQTAVATAPDYHESMEDFMARVNIIYAFLSRTQEAARDQGAHVH